MMRRAGSLPSTSRSSVSPTRVPGCSEEASGWAGRSVDERTARGVPTPLLLAMHVSPCDGNTCSRARSCGSGSGIEPLLGPTSLWERRSVDPEGFEEEHTDAAPQTTSTTEKLRGLLFRELRRKDFAPNRAPSQRRNHA